MSFRPLAPLVAVLLLGSAAALPLAPRATDPLLAISEPYAEQLGALPRGVEGVPAMVGVATGAPIRASSSAPALDLALLKMYAIAGVPLDGALQADVAAQTQRIDAPLAEDLARLVEATSLSMLQSRAIIAPEDLAVIAEDLVLSARLTTFAGSDPSAPAEWREAYAPIAAALARVDHEAIGVAAATVASAIGAFEARGASSSCDLVLDLPFVQVGGECADTYTALNFVQVDLGGADTYLNGAGAGIAGVGVGVSIDFGADGDTYVAAGSAQGFALGGVGILFDEGGSDHYNVSTFGQGMGVAGLGMLYDAGVGDDVYESPTVPTTIGTKAGGLAGVGILVDEGGHDYYHQDGLDGFVYGAAGGAGWMVELGDGDDQYVTHDMYIELLGSPIGTISGPVQISAEVGGTAILFEQGGDDVYHCGEHVRQGCQGAAGAGATTLFLERAGNDRYELGEAFGEELGGIVIFSTGQGSAYGPSAPTGFGLLHDAAGDDVYVADKWAQGYGTVGVGALLDEGGADLYVLSTTPTVGARGDGGVWADGAAGFGLDR